MGMKFRKSFKIAPGVKVNIGKKSTGVSIGGKYGGVSINSKTGTKARVSAPGTGMSYTTKVGGKTDGSSKTAAEIEGDEFLDKIDQTIEKGVKNYEKNRKAMSIISPIFIFVFVFLGCAVPLFYALAAIVFVYSIWWWKTAAKSLGCSEKQYQTDSIKPYWKKIWFWVVVVVLIVFGLSVAAGIPD